MYIIPAVLGAAVGAVGLVFLLVAVYFVKSGKDQPAEQEQSVGEH